MTSNKLLQFTLDGQPPHVGATKYIPNYVLKLASKSRGVCYYTNNLGKVRRQKNYIIYEGQ